MTSINESGLNSLILSSKLEGAKKFKRWITSEVIPTIRKHGAYMTPDTIERVLSDPDTIIRLATDLKAEQEKHHAVQQMVSKYESEFRAFGKVSFEMRPLAGSRTGQKMIARHEADFKSFGVIGFEIRKPPEGSKGGRPQKVYHLNEQQATLLMTYLRNTEVVRAFKIELVRQFYAMRQELYKVQTVKIERRAIRRTVTDAIKALPDSPNKAKKYIHYTNLAYLAAVGMTAREVWKQRGASKDAVASDYMTAAELETVADAEYRIGVLIEAGLEYQQIKRTLLDRRQASA